MTISQIPNDMVRRATTELTIWWSSRVDDRQRGASLVEYALLVAFIAIVCVIAITFLGGETTKPLNSAGSGLAGTPTTPAVAATP